MLIELYKPNLKKKKKNSVKVWNKLQDDLEPYPHTDQSEYRTKKHFRFKQIVG